MRIIEGSVPPPVINGFVGEDGSSAFSVMAFVMLIVAEGEYMPAWRHITSPGEALSIAACMSPPAGMTVVHAASVRGLNAKRDAITAAKNAKDLIIATIL